MGTTTKMQVKAILFFCLALFVAIWAVTEVQELGNDDSHNNAHESANLDAGNDDMDDSVGESAGVGFGRRGGFLSTTGSFQLSSGGSNFQGNGEEDELGEDAGVGFGRRGGFLSTTGSFQLSS